MPEQRNFLQQYGPSLAGAGLGGLLGHLALRRIGGREIPWWLRIPAGAALGAGGGHLAGRMLGGTGRDRPRGGEIDRADVEPPPLTDEDILAMIRGEAPGELEYTAADLLSPDYLHQALAGAHQYRKEHPDSPWAFSVDPERWHEPYRTTIRPDGILSELSEDDALSMTRRGMDSRARVSNLLPSTFTERFALDQKEVPFAREALPDRPRHSPIEIEPDIAQMKRKYFDHTGDVITDPEQATRALQFFEQNQGALDRSMLMDLIRSGGYQDDGFTPEFERMFRHVAPGVVRRTDDQPAGISPFAGGLA